MEGKLTGAVRKVQKFQVTCGNVVALSHVFHLSALAGDHMYSISKVAFEHTFYSNYPVSAACARVTSRADKGPVVQMVSVSETRELGGERYGDAVEARHGNFLWKLVEINESNLREGNRRRRIASVHGRKMKGLPGTPSVLDSCATPLGLWRRSWVWRRNFRSPNRLGPPGSGSKNCTTCLPALTREEDTVSIKFFHCSLM